jgi:hypothetical protein
MTQLRAYLQKAFGMPTLDREAVDRVKDWARKSLNAQGETSFAVNEIACTDPACPGVETVILVMRPGQKTRAYKVQKSLASVTEPDIRHALEA